MEDCYRKKDGARELLTQEKISCRLGCLLFWGKEIARILSCRLPLGSMRLGVGGMGRV